MENGGSARSPNGLPLVDANSILSSNATARHVMGNMIPQRSWMNAAIPPTTSTTNAAIPLTTSTNTSQPKRRGRPPKPKLASEGPKQTATRLTTSTTESRPARHGRPPKPKFVPPWLGSAMEEQAAAVDHRYLQDLSTARASSIADMNPVQALRDSSYLPLMFNHNPTTPTTATSSARSPRDSEDTDFLPTSRPIWTSPRMRQASDPSTHRSATSSSPQLVVHSPDPAPRPNSDSGPRSALPPSTSDGTMKQMSSTMPSRLFRFVEDFAVSPANISSASCAQEFSFEVNQQDYTLLVKRRMGPEGRQIYDSPEKPILYRLRCCTAKGEGLLASHWVFKPTTWPSILYFTINGHDLITPVADAQLKFGAIGISDALRPGLNNLTVYVNVPSTEKVPDILAIAIEVIRYMDAGGIAQQCFATERIIPFEQTRDAIVRSLSNQSSDDDDIIAVDASVTLSLLEPFSNANIFNVPVRGRTCTHWEAFDLFIFLNTRPNGPNASVTSIDAWKCPICGKDARPTSLVVDGFLAGIRHYLEERNLLNARAVVVSQDGS